MLLVTAVAVLVATLSPWLRDWEPSRLLRLVVLASIPPAWLALEFRLVGRRQRQAERQAGGLRLQVSTLDARERRMIMGTAAGFSVVMWAALSICATAIDGFFWLMCWMSAIAGMQVGSAYSDRLAQRVEFREHGLVHGGLFAPWSGLRKCAWQVAPGSDSQCTITAVFTGNNFLKIELIVCDWERRPIEELVAANTKLEVENVGDSEVVKE